jgi:general L-amino acid transport system substrate-binding protein
VLLVLLAFAGMATQTDAQPLSRLDKIRQRGYLGCGIEPDVPAFAYQRSSSPGSESWAGLDVDICRAIAAAIFGTGKHVEFLPAASVAEFLANDNIDLAARRLTWELRREAPFGLLFGPVTFHDGQSFLVSNKVPASSAAALADKTVCVAGGTVFEANLNEYFAARNLEIKKRILESPKRLAVIEAIDRGACDIYTADVSELLGIERDIAKPDAFRILRDQISNEPLAPVVREGDAKFFDVVRWTIFALIAAEDLSVTSANVDQMMARSTNPDVRRLLGVVPGNGQALGLSERWAHSAIKSVGNYGELFTRHFGNLDRGQNRLAKDGGLMYAPPLR